MNCLPCAGLLKNKSKMSSKVQDSLCSKANPISGSSNSRAKIFTFEELANATRNFQDDYFLGQGRHGKVYKGHLEGQVVAIRQVDQTGNRNFLVELLMLDLLRHANIINLIGYCADGDRRLLVYSCMPLGSLKDSLFDPSPGKKQLDWDIRVKIALETGKALEHLHDKAEPPVIHRNINCSTILLDDGYQAKLSDFGLAKLGPAVGKHYVSTKFEGTIGYSAPEYAMTGRLSVKSDIYSFGVVLLEIFTGRKATENSAGGEEHNLVEWARLLIKDGKFSEMVDPSVQGHYPARGLQQALTVAEMCVEAQPDKRPPIAEVVATLTHIASESQAVQNST